jgi:hypothetical protein
VYYYSSGTPNGLHGTVNGTLNSLHGTIGTVNGMHGTVRTENGMLNGLHGTIRAENGLNAFKICISETLAIYYLHHYYLFLYLQTLNFFVE